MYQSLKINYQVILLNFKSCFFKYIILSNIIEKNQAFILCYYTVGQSATSFFLQCDCVHQFSNTYSVLFFNL